MGRSPPIQGGRLESVSYLAVEQPLEALILLKRRPPTQRICPTFLLISAGGTPNPSTNKTKHHLGQHDLVLGVCIRVYCDYIVLWLRAQETTTYKYLHYVKAEQPLGDVPASFATAPVLRCEDMSSA
jgi:hypothetical protein